MIREVSLMSTFWVVLLVLLLVGPLSHWGWRARFGGYGRWRGRAFRGYSRFGCYDDDRLEQDRFDELTGLLEQRNQDVELLLSRVTELENRLDFAERVLADRKNSEVLSADRQ